VDSSENNDHVLERRKLKLGVVNCNCSALRGAQLEIVASLEGTRDEKARGENPCGGHALK
jgi:hypothetical protein